MSTNYKLMTAEQNAKSLVVIDILKRDPILDQVMGNLIEKWLVRLVPSGFCRFCGDSIKPGEKTCSAECKEALMRIQGVRLSFSMRDMKQRGFE